MEIGVKVFEEYGFRVERQGHAATKSNDLRWKYVEEVQKAVPKGGYVILYVNTVKEDSKTPTKTKNESCWTRLYHYVAILGYDVVDGKEKMFVGETGYSNSGWYPIEEFESLDENGYISDIYTIYPTN